MSTISAGTTSTTTLVATGDTTGSLVFKTNDTGSGGTTAMTINTSQNVGIGTSSPAAKLDIGTGNLNFSGSAQRITGDFSNATLASRVMFQTSTTNGITAVYAMPNGSSTTTLFGGWSTTDPTNCSEFSIGTDGSTEVNFKSSKRGTGTYLPMTFYTGGSDRMRIDSSGNLLVGTTNATAKLAVEQTSATNAINANINYASSTNIAGIRVTKYDNNTTTSQRFVEFVINAGASGCGQINANGASTAAFGSYSDERLKENIVDLPSQLSNIMALRPVEFDYIGVEDGHQIGFIAQEMQKVYPDAVSVGNDEMLMITAWSKTEARLVKAIQEQQALITQLTERISALENK